MDDLIGRDTELQELSHAWQTTAGSTPQLAVVWGRRRVGKTFLLTHFARGKRAVYFTATRQDSEQRQVQRFAAAVREQLGEDVADLMGGGFPDWEAALRFVVRLAADESLLVVLDEAPRLLAGRPDFADLLSAVWEVRSGGTKLMLVLSGSAVSVIEQMLGPQGGLHRRATVERRMDPFSFADARPFLPTVPAAQFVQAYAACGGYPLHLRRWDPEQSPTENMSALAYAPAAVLLRDALDIISEDLDWRGGYERVLGALGAGNRRRSRIAGRAQQRIDYTLDRLRRSGYVRVARPHGAPAGADPQYEIADTYLAFWFGVLRDDADLVEGGRGGAVAERVAGRWQQHVGRVFEQAAREHAVRLVQSGHLPASTTVGRWWRDETAEVDVLGLLDGRTRLVGEVRWQQRPMTMRDVRELHGKLAALPTPHPDLVTVLWSRGGAAAELGSVPDLWNFDADDVVG